MQVKVSCIIGVYNGEEHIRAAIKSIVQQTYENIEIIVVDDGSTDGTRDIVNPFTGQVRYIFKGNGGHASACNHGIKEAQGEIIAFLDSDDLWYKRKIEKQVQLFINDPHLQFSTTFLQEFYHPDVNHHVRKPMPGYVTTTLMARKKLFTANGFFNEQMKHSHATDWFARMRTNNVKEKRLEEVLAYRRVHDKNLSWGNAGESHDEHLHLIKSILDQRRKKTTKE